MTAVSVSNAWSYDRLIQRSGAMWFMLLALFVADPLRRACPELFRPRSVALEIDPSCLVRGHRLLLT
jgi:hypothetical protein